MVIQSSKAGWAKDKGRDELDAQLRILGTDENDAEHIGKAAGYDWVVVASKSVDGALVLDVQGIAKAVEPPPVAPTE